MKRILFIRLSSAGDVLLTTPVVRCVKKQLSDAEVHFLTKEGNADLLRYNPYIDKLITLGSGGDALGTVIRNLQTEHYDYIIDLHNNHRSRRIRRALRRPCRVYRKENLHKFLFVFTKKNIMSGSHVVDRYMRAVQTLGVNDDGGGLDCFLAPDTDWRAVATEITGHQHYVAIACGAQHATKQIPVDRIKWLCHNVQCPVVLLGDKNDGRRLVEGGVVESDDTTRSTSHVVNLCGKTTMSELAAVVGNADVVVTPDSLTLHLAAAFQRPAIAIWGATNPSFGFSSFRAPHSDYVTTLHCHPCSRMGSDKCPYGHYNCMYNHDWQSIASLINERND